MEKNSKKENIDFHPNIKNEIRPRRRRQANSVLLRPEE